MNNVPEKIKQDVERIESIPDINIGQWYWIKGDEDEKDEFFGCIIEIGSNYITLQSPKDYIKRIHFNDFYEKCRLEKDSQKVISENGSRITIELRQKMDEIKSLTMRLGLQDIQSLPEQSLKDTLLPVQSSGNELGNYKKSLIKAKEKQLPDLFKEIKELNKELSYWLNAEAIPIRAMSKNMEKSVKLVEDRIFNVELYSGLIEEIKLVKDGESADIGEIIHIMQRRCYMDEECLIDYQHGGINFKKIDHFDEWLSKNMDRILPFSKCVVSFRIRRKKKNYTDIEWNPFVRVLLDENDKKTFLYIRNGEKLYRLITEIDFGEKLFPDTSEFHPGEKVWASFFAGNINEIVSERVYKERLDKEKERKRLESEWYNNNPDECWIHNPHNHEPFYRLENYEPCDSSSVYFDDIKKEIADQAKQYNRIALIIQGLLDRSEVFHPHPDIKMWDYNSFNSRIKLIYDATMVLTDGDAPDFEDYRSLLNKSIKVGTFVIGQEDFWMRQEAVKENNRQRNDWRIREPSKYECFSPYGNPGPGLIAKVISIRGGKCRFEWYKERINDSWNGNKIKCSISVPKEKLFNADAYKPGDYHRFFDDPRTRQQYLEWAPMMLAAEDFHAGKLK